MAAHSNCVLLLMYFEYYSFDAVEMETDYLLKLATGTKKIVYLETVQCMG